MARTRKKPVPVPAGEGVEVTDAPVQVVDRAAAIDVAKGSGMVCTRLPSDTRAGRRTQRVWEVTATFAAVVTLMDHLRSQGIQRLVLESTSDYWRIWYYLAEAAGLEVWLVNARDVRHLPGRSKSDREDCAWLCKLNEWGMLRRSFVPPEQIRDLRALTRLRTHLVHDRTRHQNRIEKILEDALLKISSLISDLMGASGRRMLAALVNGERSPRALAALGDCRLKATPAQLEAALTGRFRDIHALETGMLLELIDDLTVKITRLDGQITRLLEQIPGIRGVCTSCGLIGGGHAPACASDQARVLSVIERLDEITGVGTANAQVIVAELGTSMAQFPTPGHAAAWARLTSRTIQSGTTTKNRRTARVSAGGELVALVEQDRGAGDTALIAEGHRLVRGPQAPRRGPGRGSTYRKWHCRKPGRWSRHARTASGERAQERRRLQPVVVGPAGSVRCRPACRRRPGVGSAATVVAASPAEGMPSGRSRSSAARRPAR